MSLQILPKPSLSQADPNVRAVLEHLQANQKALALEDAIAFYNFPLFREDENLLIAQIVVISPNHGVLLASTSNTLPADGEESQEILLQLEGAFNQIFSRLVKYPKLRQGRAQLAFPVDAILWIPEAKVNTTSDTVKIGLQSLSDVLRQQELATPIEPQTFEELVSVLDGSKVLIRPRDRRTKGFPATSKISLIADLEEEIRRFDRDQRVAYMTEVLGTQRIRGLAGSGKTVVLAMKAALTAIRDPDARIAVTFYTKSLYQHLKQLITRFYRLHEDKDPDWNKLRILHAWGGETAPGLYHLAAKTFGHTALTFGQASTKSRQPFAFACEQLIADPSVKDLFDYVFVDEAQDFPQEFMKLAIRLAREAKLVIAYDAFQTIFDVEVPTAGSLFGVNAQGEPLVDFDEDIILHKCYRNPREILVCAHAIGLGIYSSKIVQMLESKEHWDDLGYIVASGELTSGEQITIERPKQNSPSSISDHQTLDELITADVFANLHDEVAHVVDKIVHDINVEGISPEDILVICVDDRNAQGYFKVLHHALQAVGINTNNLQSDSYSIPDFQKEGRITLSTVYKAKGNEAYVVHLMGIDGVFGLRNAVSRNRAFTAMTRAKGWLSVTGIGTPADRFRDELKKAKARLPNLEFEYPGPEQLIVMKRDLSKTPPEEVDETIARWASEMEPEELEQLLMRRLREVRSRKKPRKKIS